MHVGVGVVARVGRVQLVGGGHLFVFECVSLWGADAEEDARIYRQSHGNFTTNCTCLGILNTPDGAERLSAVLAAVLRLSAVLAGPAGLCGLEVPPGGLISGGEAPTDRSPLTAPAPASPAPPAPLKAGAGACGQSCLPSVGLSAEPRASFSGLLRLAARASFASLASFSRARVEGDSGREAGKEPA